MRTGSGAASRHVSQPRGCGVGRVSAGGALSFRSVTMARGRKPSRTITLTPEDRQTLLAWQRSTTIPVGRARRGQILLLLADGMPVSQIADTLGVTYRVVSKWAQRFLQDGIAGLADQPGRGRRPSQT